MVEPSQQILSNKIILSLSCRNLADLDTFSLSDPEVHVYLKTGRHSQQYTLLGKTEMIMNNLNPDFVKTFTVEYFFEKEQSLKFEVYDVDGPSTLEHIGNAELTLAQLMTSKAQTLVRELTLPSGGG